MGERGADVELPRVPRPRQSMSVSGDMLAQSVRPMTRTEVLCEWRDSRLAAFFEGIPVRYPLRAKVKIKLQASREGRSWDAFQTLLSLTACVIYVVETYDVEVTPVLEMIFTVFFTVDYVLRLYAADSRSRYPLTGNALVDIATIAPVYIEWFTTTESRVALFSFFRFVRVLRVMRILRAFKIVNTSLSAVDRQLFRLVLTVASIVFLSAGLVQMVEDQMFETFMGYERGCDPEVVDDDDCERDVVTFGDSLYFIVVTISTVGYGDIAPQTDIGRFIVSGMLVVSLIVVPMQVNKLTLLLAMQSPFRRHYQPETTTPHVLVVGYVSNTSVLHDFFTEFFHPDRFVLSTDMTIQNTNVIIMAPHEPPEELQALIMNPIIENKVFYVKGSVMNEEDLYRVAADEAVACFILCDKSSPTPVLEDAQTVLRALVLENFNPAMDTLVQLNSPRHRNHLIQADADRVICVDEMKMCIMAQSCVCPGLSTLISNLFRSTETVPDDEASWRTEYMQGCDLEIYCVPLPKLLHGLTFLDAYTTVYEAFHGQVLLIGVEERLPGPEVEAKAAEDEPAAGEQKTAAEELTKKDRSPVTTTALLNTDEDVVSMFVNPGHTFRMGCNKREGGVRCVPYAYVLAADGGIAGSIALEDAYDRDAVRRLRRRRDRRDRRDPPRRHIAELQRDLVPRRPLTVRDRPVRVVDDVRSLGVAGHVLVVATIALDNIECLLAPLRSDHIVVLPVVILAPRGGAGDIANLNLRLPRMPEIFVVHRATNEMEDLQRAGVQSARCCLILADRTTTKEIDGTTLDHSVIFHHLALEHMLAQSASNLFTLVELSSPSTMKVMNNTTMKRLQEVRNTRRSQMARRGTSVRLAAVMSPLQHPSVAAVPEEPDSPVAATPAAHAQAAAQGLFGRNEASRSRQKQRRELRARRRRRAQVTFGTAEHTMLPMFAAGLGFSTDMFDNLLCQTFFTPELLRFTELFLSMDETLGPHGSDDASHVSSYVTQIPVPSHLVGHTFADLNDFMVDWFHAVPFALYRAPADDISLPYVYTGPWPETVLRAQDRVFVLAPRRTHTENNLTYEDGVSPPPTLPRAVSVSPSPSPPPAPETKPEPEPVAIAESVSDDEAPRRGSLAADEELPRPRRRSSLPALFPADGPALDLSLPPSAAGADLVLPPAAAERKSVSPKRRRFKHRRSSVG